MVDVTLQSKRTIVAKPAARKSVLINQAPLINGAATSLANLIDVNLDNLTDGSVLVYNGSVSQFEATNTLEKQILNGGHF